MSTHDFSDNAGRVGKAGQSTGQVGSPAGASRAHVASGPPGVANLPSIKARQPPGRAKIHLGHAGGPAWLPRQNAGIPEYVLNMNEGGRRRRESGDIPNDEDVREGKGE